MFYKEYSITPSILRSAMERDGEMSKLRAMTGLRISSSPTASTYIWEKKIRNILQHYKSNIPYKETKKIDKILSRLDFFGFVEMRYLYHLATEESVSEMIKAVSMTMSALKKISHEWAKGVDD